MTVSNTIETPRREPARPSAKAPEVPAVEAPPRKKPMPLIVLGVIVIALAVWGIRKFTFAQHHVETDNAQVDGHITPVAPKVQAFVADVLVEENQHVKVGDTLVVLDDRDLKVRLDQAEADYAAALAATGSRSRAGQAVAQLAASEAQAQSAQATIASAEAAVRKATADLERIRGLASQKIVPAQQLDAAQAADDAAEANLEAAKRQASAAGSEVAASGAAVSGAEARLASARAAVDNARLQLSYTVITAPMSGVDRPAECGAGRAGAGRADPALDRPRQGRVGHGQPEGDPARPTSRWATRSSSRWTPIPAAPSGAQSRA